MYGGARQGAKPYQEDSFFSWCSPHNKAIVGGIFDGHGGYNGLLASQTARDTALHFLQNNANECESWSVDRWKTELNSLFSLLHATIRQSFLTPYTGTLPTGSAAPAPGDAFSNTRPPQEQRHVDEKGIVRNAAGDPIHGGSTATVVVMIRDDSLDSATIITANVGDSTAFLVPNRGKLWDFLSVDHGPENQDEWVRVNVSAEESHRYTTKLLFVYDKTHVFRKYECPCVFLPDGTKDQAYVANPWGHGLHPTNVRYEPAVYAVTPKSVTKDSTCIAMTRALGDFYAGQFGLTHIPSITVKRVQLHPDRRTSHHPSNGMDCAASASASVSAMDPQAWTIFLASDGVWDTWKYDDLMQFINDELQARGKNLLEMGEAVLEESIARAITNFGAKHYDDACLVVWQFDPVREKQLIMMNQHDNNQTMHHSQQSAAQPQQQQEVRPSLHHQQTYVQSQHHMQDGSVANGNDVTMQSN